MDRGYVALSGVNITDTAVPYIEAQGTTLAIQRFGVTLGTAFASLHLGLARTAIAGPISLGSLTKYVTVDKPIRVELKMGSIVVVPDPSAKGIRLVGFKGWTLNLGIHGTTVSNILIPSDTYDVDFPLGFTAVIIADMSSRIVSIVSAAPPPQVEEGTVSMPRWGGKEPTQALPVIPPSSSLEPSPMVMLGTFAAVAIAAYKLTRNAGSALATAGIIGVLMALVFQGDNMFTILMISITAIIVGLGFRTTSQQ